MIYHTSNKCLLYKNIQLWCCADRIFKESPTIIGQCFYTEGDALLENRCML